MSSHPNAAPSPTSDDHAHEPDLEVALDFLNTLHLHGGEQLEDFAAPADAASWFGATGVIHADPDAWTVRDLRRTRDVRDALRELVDAAGEGRPPDREAIAAVNDVIVARPRRVLTEAGGRLRLSHVHGSRQADEALAAIATPIVRELVEGRPERFRTCANETCAWSFFDASPTGRRRWCDMRTCGNRAKAARHRERTRTAEPKEG